MNLLLDVGNTRIKWRSWQAGRLLPGGALSHEEFLAALVSGQVVTAAPRRVLIACVGHEALRQRLQQLIAERFGVAGEFFLASAEAGGIRNAYAEAERLGVDRWLALRAARHHVAGPVLVVDAGSALTLDVLAADGNHLGGLIVPGLGMMQASLFAGTGQVRFPLDRPCWPAPGAPLGTDTETAVKYGSVWSAVGLIEGMRTRAEPLLGAAPACLLTGGDAEALSAYLSSPARVLPDLVLEGLALQAGLELLP